MRIIPLASVVVRKRQRRNIAAGPLNELKESILTVGLLHPPVMWQDGEQWVLSVGERRLRAIQEIAKQPNPPGFNCGETYILPGQIPITPLGDYLDEVGRFEAELAENTYREDVDWPDRIQAMADLHAMRLRGNPKQTVAATAAELVDIGTLVKSTTSLPQSAASSGPRQKLAAAITIAEHLDDPAIASARNEKEALQLILRNEEAKINAELIRRYLKQTSASVAPLVELRHGDALAILPTLDAERFDLILADPPYGIGANAGGFRSRTVHHHNYIDDPTVARDVAQCILTEGFRITRPRANLFMFCDIDLFPWLKEAAAQAGWVPFRRPLVWRKSESEGLAPWGDRGPRVTTEYILFATKGQRGLVASPTDVFDERRVSRAERDHGAEKPVELLRRLIECSTLPGEAVLDPCCGTGASLVACRDSKRLGLGIERDETYYNIALGRLHAPTAEPSDANSSKVPQDG